MLVGTEKWKGPKMKAFKEQQGDSYVEITRK